VIGENVRVEQAFTALERGELDRFGELMLASHASLREDFEVSCRELDVLVELASGCRGVYGCRMTGGGFGGCTVNLVQEEHADAFCRAIQVGYRDSTRIELSIYRV
jgi:galactokinase